MCITKYTWALIVFVFVVGGVFAVTTITDSNSIFGGTVNLTSNNITDVNWINPYQGGIGNSNNVLKMEGQFFMYNDNTEDGNRFSMIFHNGTQGKRLGALSCHTNKGGQNYSECTFYAYNSTDVANGVWDVKGLTSDYTMFRLRTDLRLANKNVTGVKYLAGGDGEPHLLFENALYLYGGNMSFNGNNLYDITEIGESSTETRFKFFAKSVQLKYGNLSIDEMSGSGNDYACFDSTGKLFRSNAAC